jgi:hypothetical protein
MFAFASPARNHLNKHSTVAIAAANEQVKFMQNLVSVSEFIKLWKIDNIDASNKWNSKIRRLVF